MIQVKVEKKVASLVNKNDFIVCGNNDYQIEFLFDEEWNSQPVKTARFVWNNQYQDVVFTGTVCNVPIINNALFISIGVYAGELRTTTPAMIVSKKSILCNDPIHVDPPEDIYNQLVSLMELIGLIPGGLDGQVLKKKSDEDFDVIWAYEEGGGGEGTQNHSKLYNLDFEHSGHTGFQKELKAGKNITIEEDGTINAAGGGGGSVEVEMWYEEEVESWK